jgi:urate oxidase
MGIRLASQVYGKSSVRLTKVTRRADRHDLIELVIDISLEGDFTESYLTGDNRRVVPTDTMKNTVYALAAEHPLPDPESFALSLSAHFLDRFSHIAVATIAARQTLWQRIETAGGRHHHSFIGAGAEQRTCSVGRTRNRVTVEVVDADDRIFAGRLAARWTYTTADVDWNSTFTRARAAMIGVFADHKSLAVQQTLFAMGAAALEVCPEVERIELSMSNEHRVPVNLEPFGRPNKNEVFVATTEPFGLISAVLEREGR